MNLDQTKYSFFIDNLNNDKVKRDLVYKLILLNKNIIINDIGNVNFIKNYTHNNVELEPITPIFCDNLVLFSLYPESSCDLVSNRRVLLQRFHTSSLNNVIRQSLINSKIIFDNKCGIKVLNPYFLHTYEKEKYVSKQRENILKTLKIHPDIKKCYNTRYVNKLKERIVTVPIKIELSQTPINEIINNLKLFFEDMFPQNIYLLDIDFTQDFAGSKPGIQQEATLPPNRLDTLLGEKMYEIKMFRELLTHM
jgi:hypothetical protein